MQIRLPADCRCTDIYFTTLMPLTPRRHADDATPPAAATIYAFAFLFRFIFFLRATLLLRAMPLFTPQKMPRMPLPIDAAITLPRCR